MKILALVPGGQTNGNSPSEILIKEVARQRPDWNIKIINFTFDDLSIFKYNFSNIDLVWSDMDGKEVIQVGALLKKKYGMKFYAHGEWVPPYRVLEGYNQKYLCEDDFSGKDYYMKMLEAMEKADLVSLGLPYHSIGSFKWIEDNFGISFKNFFVRHNYVKRFPYIKEEREYKVATIARVWDKKKRVLETIKALFLFKTPPQFDIIGANTESIKTNYKGIINLLGIYDNDEKVNIFRTATAAIQHWSGIPPAEAMTQFCPVVSFYCEEMEYDYGDSIIWSKSDDVYDLADKLEYVFLHPEEMKLKAEENYNKLCNNKLKVNFVDVRAKEVIKKIEEIL
jgi:glycosyltransferase involved in cell wall biosynthesis